MSEQDRVVITGLGLVSPNGQDRVTFWESLTHGITPIQKLNRFSNGFKTQIAAQIENFSALPFITEKQAQKMSRFTQLALVAAKKAMADTHYYLDETNNRRLGVILGTGIGGIEVVEHQHKDFMEKGPGKINPFAAASIVPHAATTEISVLLGIKGPNMTVSTGCSSGLNAIGMAYDSIKQGRAEAMLAGGTEAPLSPLTFATFDAAREMSTQNATPTKACRPFDLNRDGYVLSEGAAVLVLERMDIAKKRGAHIYGEIVGFGSTGDAYHSYKLDPQGNSVVVAIEMALKEAKLAPEEIDWVLAHGSGSKGGDQKESSALIRVFKDYASKLPVTAIKSIMGMPFGASGPFQLMAAVLGFESGLIPKTLNYETPDPACAIHVIGKETLALSTQTALMTSFGLGGNNSVLIAQKI